jgi:hypothetical protein
MQLDDNLPLGHFRLGMGLLFQRRRDEAVASARVRLCARAARGRRVNCHIGRPPQRHLAVIRLLKVSAKGCKGKPRAFAAADGRLTGLEQGSL